MSVLTPPKAISGLLPEKPRNQERQQKIYELIRDSKEPLWETAGKIVDIFAAVTADEEIYEPLP